MREWWNLGIPIYQQWGEDTESKGGNGGQNLENALTLSAKK